MAAFARASSDPPSGPPPGLLFPRVRPVVFWSFTAGTETRGTAFGGCDGVPTTRPGWLKLSVSLREQMLPIVVVVRGV